MVFVYWRALAAGVWNYFEGTASSTARIEALDICRHTAYNVGMSTIQYTIRAVPRKLDNFLRSQARMQGKSLNQIVLDYIEQATKLDLQQTDEDFDWIIGADTLDSDSLQAIVELKATDKLKSRL